MIKQFLIASANALLYTTLSVSNAHADLIIDGILSEPEWAQARVFTEFVTTEPLSGETAKYLTEVRLFTNDKGIYVGFTNYQPSSVAKIDRRFARDARIEADRNVFGVDFDGTGLSAYLFTVGSGNSKRDGVRNSNDFSSSWDGEWYSGTSAEDDRWYSELYIPWTVAPMSNQDDEKRNISVWFSRVVYSESLRFAYPNASSKRERFLEDWHSLEIEQAQASSLDWFPYISFQQNLLGSDSSDSSDSEDAKVGLDFIWRPNSSTQLTGALNPDFGQVESDDLVVNLSAYETLLEEKRPFFTENQTLFDSELPNEDRLLHSRRIGVAGNSLVDIDLAAKITHFGGSTDYGLFIVSEDDNDLYLGANYLATRVQNKTGNVTLGHRLTYVDKPQLNRQATVHAIDMDWFASDTVGFSGQLFASHIKQDANLLENQQAIDKQDYAGWVNWTYAPSDQWFHILYLSHYGDQFDFNDMGYMRRNDFNEFYGQTRYDKLQYDAQSKYLSSYVELEYGYKETTEGDRLELWFNLNHRRVFRSTETLFINVGAQHSGWDDRITRGNGDYAQPSQYWGELKYGSRKDKNFSYKAELNFDTWGTEKISPGIVFKPKLYINENLTLGGRLEYKYYPEWLLWDFDYEQLANYQAKSFSADIKLDWYPSSRQEVRLKFQWVGIDAQEQNSYTLNDRGNLSHSFFQSENFSYSDTALQMRYRYQLGPLSDIYIVYSRGGYFESGSGNEGAKDLFDNGWRNTHVESIVAKVRYKF